MADNKQSLAVQPVNFYKANGRFVFYVEVKPRAFKDKDPALSYGKTSVVSMNIFDTEAKTGVTAYLEPGDPAFLYEKVKSHFGDAKDKPENACYNLAFNYGQYNGKTVAEFVNSATKEEVTTEYNRLKASTEYKRNAEFAKAIVEAVNLKNEGKLITGNAGVKEILLSELKTPNNKKLDANGNTECRAIEILYDSNQKEPYRVKISNFMAPPANGMVGAIVSKATDKSELMMSFSEKDFFYVCDEMLKAKELYAKTTEASRIRYAQENAWKPE